MRLTRIFFMLLFGFVLVSPSLAQRKITPLEAKDHIGESATVCGSVVSLNVHGVNEGKTTFIILKNISKLKSFTVVIWGSNRSRFGTPESEYKGKRICVTGKIADYRGVPEIVASNPEQIRAE